MRILRITMNTEKLKAEIDTLIAFWLTHDCDDETCNKDNRYPTTFWLANASFCTTGLCHQRFFAQLDSPGEKRHSPG